MSGQTQEQEVLFEPEQENEETSPGEADAWAIVATFDARLTEAERRIDRVLARQHGAAIERVTADVASLRERVIRLENQEEILVEKARSAAGAAASQVAMVSSADLALRIGRLEERTRHARLEGPAS